MALNLRMSSQRRDRHLGTSQGPELRRYRPYSVISLVLVVALLLIACSASSRTTASSPPSPPETKPTPALAATAESTLTPTPTPRPEQPRDAAAVKLAADFQIQVYRGEEVLRGKDARFSNLFGKGKPVVLNFFAGLCPPCRAEMPDIQSVSAQYQDRVTIFGLDIGPFVALGSRDDGMALVQELGITYPTGTTFDEKTVRAYRVIGMPTTVFLTPDGKVFRHWTGILTRAKLVELIEELLKASGA